MKTFAFLFTVCSLLFVCSACDNDDNDQNEREQIVGVWKLTSITGGFAGSGSAIRQISQR